MSVKLTKNQVFSLSKEEPNLKKIMCGLGWDVGKKSGKTQLYDLDSYAICIDNSGKISDRKSIIYFNNLVHPSGAIEHQGDNITGIGDGDDEKIIVDLVNLPSEIARIFFIINIYRGIPRKHFFSELENAFVRLVNLETDREIVRFTLSAKEYKNVTGLFLAEVHRDNSEWEIEAIGQGFQANDLDEIIAKLNLNP